MTLGLALFFMAVGATITSIMAAEKNRSIGGWAIGGALLPLICIVVLAASPALPGPTTDDPARTRAGY